MRAHNPHPRACAHPIQHAVAVTVHAPRDGPGSVSSRCMHLLTTSVSPSCSSTISAMWAERRFGMGVGMGPGTGRTECESSRVSYVACAACVRNGAGVPYKVRNFVQKMVQIKHRTATKSLCKLYLAPSQRRVQPKTRGIATGGASVSARLEGGGSTRVRRQTTPPRDTTVGRAELKHD